MRRRPAALAAAVAPAIALALLSACATPSPSRTPVVGLALRAGAVDIRAIDIDSVRVTADIVMENEGELPVTLDRLRAGAGSEGLRVELDRDLRSELLGPRAETTARLEFDIDAPPGDSPTVTLGLDAAVSFSAPGGAAMTASASMTGEYPRVMPPTLSIASIRILKDELVNTKLRVDLVVENPNAFPLSFAELEYRLYGEGRYWASGSLAAPFDVPPRLATAASLYLTMNFTDMDRSLLDRVIKLSTVRYRLVGTGRVGTGLEFLPRFDLPFDMAGETGVSR